MTEKSNHASDSYFFACHKGERSFSPETVFFRIDDDSLTSDLLGLLKKAYGGGERNPIFHAQAIVYTDEADQVLLDEAIDELAKYEDPNPYRYPSWPPRQTMLRASYAQKAEWWVKMLLFRKENVSNHAKVQKLAEALKKLEEVTREFLSLSENLAYWHFPGKDLPTYRHALWEAEAHVDGISACLECSPQSGQIETGLRETLHALSREVEELLRRVWVYQLPNEITAPARKAFDDFSRIYTELSQSGFKPDRDLFKKSTATKGHVDTPEGCCSLEEERKAAQEQRQMERAEWVRNWAELQGELKKARSAVEVVDVLRVLAKSIDQWARELDSAVDDLFRRDADSVSRRRIICDRYLLYDYDDEEDEEEDDPLFLTVPFVGASHALSMLEFSKEDVMAEGLDKRLGEIDEDRESLCEKVVVEVRQWDDSRILQQFPDLDLGRRSLQRKAEACTEYIDTFVALRQSKSNSEDTGSPSHNSATPPEQYPAIRDDENKYDWARQVELCKATNNVLGEDKLNPGVVSRACSQGQIDTNGKSGLGSLVKVSSFLSWVSRKHDLPKTERTQIRNAIIGEINERNSQRNLRV